MPVVALTTAWDENVSEIDPCLANQLALLVVVEYGYFELVVVGGVVDSESELLVPSGRLAAADVGSGLLCFLSQTYSTVGVLLANGLEVGQVLCAIHHQDESTYLWAVGGCVGVEGAVGDDKRLVYFGRHLVGVCRIVEGAVTVADRKAVS